MSKLPPHPKYEYLNKAYELDVKPTIKLIILRIINRISTPNKGPDTPLISYPGANDLLKVLHCSERQLRRYIKELRSLDLFIIGSKAVSSGEVNTYTINPKCVLWMDENPLEELSSTMTPQVNTMTPLVQHHDTLGPNTMTPQVNTMTALSEHHDTALSSEYSSEYDHNTNEDQEDRREITPPATITESDLLEFLGQGTPTAFIPETAGQEEPGVGLTPDSQNLQPRSPGMHDLQFFDSQSLTTPLDNEEPTDFESAWNELVKVSIYKETA